MFWRKDKNGPVELSGFLSRALAKEWEKLPTVTDHWVKYMAVKRAHEDDKNICDIRIFDQTAADQGKIKIVNYESLDEHPELITFEGWYNEKEKKSDIKLKKAA